LRPAQGKYSMRANVQNNQSKIDWRRQAQVVEHLLCKGKALNSGPLIMIIIIRFCKCLIAMQNKDISRIFKNLKASWKQKWGVKEHMI
jgi:hypothetical protein